MLSDLLKKMKGRSEMSDFSSTVPPVLLESIAGLKAHDVDKIATTVGEDLRFITQASIVNKGRFLSFLRVLYAAFPDWHYDHDEPELQGNIIAVKWRQGGTHTGTLALPGMDAVPATGKKVTIPEQFFFYRVRGDKIVEIRPDPIAGGAPQGIFEQIGVEWPKGGNNDYSKRRFKGGRSRCGIRSRGVEKGKE